MARHVWTFAPLFALLVLSAAASAQLPVQLRDAPPPSADLVVTARPDPSATQVQQQAKAISRVADLHDEPLARFSAAVCPGIMGLPTDVAELLVDRIRYNATRAGARVAGAGGCKANVILAFVREGRTRIGTLMDSAPQLFKDLDAAEIREIENETGPAHSWSLTELRNRYGEAESPHISQNSALYIDGPSPRMGPMRTINVPGGGSQLLLSNRIDILYSVVVIDVAAIDGLSVDQIADYATMRALARTRPPEGDTRASTILSLFDPAGQAPPQMTDFDVAYLRSLYQDGASLSAATRIGGVARTYRKTVAQTRAVSSPAK